MKTNEQLFQGSWADGPAGTGEMTWLMAGGFEGMPKWQKGGLAKSWEINRAELSMTFHLQEGVHWHNKPPTNGRELVADDVIFTLRRNWESPTGFLHNAYPAPIDYEEVDKYTVKVYWDTWPNLTNDVMQIGGIPNIQPRDAVEYYGDMRDWRNAIGTGPFLLTDYVTGASMTFVRNDNYWDVDPVGPGKGNQLPYLDGCKILVIGDSSTRAAAMRTAKADQGYPFEWEEAATLRATNPELQMVANPYNGYLIFLRQDNPDFPWTNKQVRHALMMGVDYRAIAEDYYGGEGSFFCFPVPDNQEYDDIRIEFEDLPQDIQDLWDYNPEKAKQLLADAGYANGFDLEVVCRTLEAELMSIYKGYYEKIGVNLIIDQKEDAAYNSICNGRTHKHAYFGTAHQALLFNMDSWRDPEHMSWNGCWLYDDRLDQAWVEIWDNYLDWDEQCRLFKEQIAYILDGSWMIPSPSHNQYTIWQPWIMDYHGEINLGNCDRVDFTKWVWVDQDMKEQMTGIQK